MNDELEYARKPVESDRSTFWLQAWTVIFLVLTAWAIFTCALIEVQNVKAGNYLPRDFSTDGGQWRESRVSGPRDTLRQMVESVGLMQYPLVLTLLLGLPALWTCHRQCGWLTIIGGCFVLALICAVLMVYRGYFTSLGW